MKKYLCLFLIVTATSNFAMAQTETVAKKPELTKEEKAALKAKQEADVMEAYKEAGLSEEQISKCKDAVAEANKKSNELKKNNALTEEQKTAAKKVISDEKNATLKAIMGADAYKKYNAARKRQKENAGAAQ